MKSEHSDTDRMKHEPEVSIVTPVHNGEEFLAECIESVLAQTYRNWNYVIVNNRSTDKSLEIAKFYAAKDDRIRVHANESFLKVMDNLNHTFRQISPGSKYCKVIHADDWMFPECIERMVHHAEEYPSAGIVNSYYLDDKIVRPQGLKYPSHLNPGRDIGKQYLLNHHTYFGAPSNLLIPSELIRKREEVYDPENIHSDHSFCLDVLKEYDFGFIHQVLTFSRRHEASHTNRVAEKYGTYSIGKIRNLLKYGPYYLEAKERDEKLNSTIESYYRSFIRRSVYRFSKDIFNYHIAEIQRMGLKVNYKKIVKYFLGAIFDARVVLSYLSKKMNM